VNESCHTYEWVVPHMWMSHVAHVNESCRTCEWVVSHIWVSRVTHVNESCLTCQWVVCHMSMSCVTPMSESCHTYEKSHVTNRPTGWRRPIGCLKLQVIFRKRATNYRPLLRKMTYKDKASCESSPPCTPCQTCEWIMSLVRLSCVTLVGESHHTCEKIMSHIWMRHVTNMHFSCRRFDICDMFEMCGVCGIYDSWLRDGACVTCVIYVATLAYMTHSCVTNVTCSKCVAYVARVASWLMAVWHVWHVWHVWYMWQRWHIWHITSWHMWHVRNVWRM